MIRGTVFKKRIYIDFENFEETNKAYDIFV